MQNSHLNLNPTRLTNIWVLIFSTLKRNINFLIESNLLKCQFHDLFGGTKLRNVPDGFGDFNRWLLIKNKALDTGGGIVNVVSRVWQAEEDFFDEIWGDDGFRENGHRGEAKDFLDIFILALKGLAVSDRNHLNVFPDVRMLLLWLSCNVVIVVFYRVKKLKEHTKFGLELKDVNGFVLEFQWWEVLKLQIIVNSIDDSLPYSFAN